MDEPLNLAKAPSINKPHSRRVWRAGFHISRQRSSVGEVGSGEEARGGCRVSGPVGGGAADSRRG